MFEFLKAMVILILSVIAAHIAVVGLSIATGLSKEILHLHSMYMGMFGGVVGVFLVCCFYYREDKND